MEAAAPPERGEVDVSKPSEVTREVRVKCGCFFPWSHCIEVSRDISRQSGNVIFTDPSETCMCHLCVLD